MGANPHERLVPLWRDGAVRRTRLTPQEAWQDVSSQEGYENGHSYSGDFGSKHGMRVIATTTLNDAQVRAAGELVAHYNGTGEDPFRLSRKLVYCSGLPEKEHWRLTSPQACTACKGTGKRARTDEETAAERKKIAARKKALAVIGEAQLRRAAELYDDKWGEAVGIVGKDSVWFGGWCSS